MIFSIKIVDTSQYLQKTLTLPKECLHCRFLVIALHFLRIKWNGSVILNFMCDLFKCAAHFEIIKYYKINLAFLVFKMQISDVVNVWLELHGERALYNISINTISKI